MCNSQLFLYREKKILSFLSLLDKELYCSLQLKQVLSNNSSRNNFFLDKKISIYQFVYN